MVQFFLYESAIGFALFKLQTLDKLSLQDPKIQQAFDNFQEFKKIVSLEANHLFQGHNVAWKTIQDLKEGRLPEELKNFIKTNLPSLKKTNLEFAVQDKKLAELLNSEMGLKCVSGELYLEVFRGLRNHSIRFLSGEEASVDANRVSMANLGIGHAIARNNIQFDEKRQDKPIMNSFTLLDQMEKNLNTFCMRLRESYGWHFPELGKLITDNETYVRLVKNIGNKDNLDGVDMAELSELAGEASVAEAIIDAYRTSMGNDLGDVDEKSVTEFADYVLRHFQFKKDLQEYLKGEMEKVAPNLTSLLGESVGARLLTYAGGLNNLAKLPASTIQILGAEKALFRALKKRGSTPKYGLLFNSSFITRAGARNKGQISRMLANKCALSARLDNFLVNVS